MEVYFVYDDYAEEGYMPLHIASTKEKAEAWVEDYVKEHKGSTCYTIEIEKVEVDSKERIL